MKIILLLILMGTVVFGIYLFTGGSWGTDKIFGPPETLPFTRYDEVDVNVYFYFPDGSELYLGETKGSSSCGSMAHAYAYEKGLDSNHNWSYVCCTIEDGSDCYRKIR